MNPHEPTSAELAVAAGDHSARLPAASRREFLKTLAAAGVALTPIGALSAWTQLREQAQSRSGASRRIIDVHHHIIPPNYVAAHRDDMQRGGAIRGQVLQWTPQVSLDQMDAAGVARAILSISTPGSWFGSVDDGRRMSREINEFVAQMIREHPARFGLFAALPLPDAEGSLKEIEYAFDTLHADGIGLMTSYDTVPVGDKSFWPVFDELNRRSAIVFLHRTVATCCLNLRPLPNYPVAEFIVDDLRAINSLLTSGTLARYPNIRWIHAHGDKTLPWLAELSGVADSHGRPHPAAAAEPNPPYAPQGVLKELQKVFVDSAGNAKYTMAQLRNLDMLTTRTMFGTDVPYGNTANSIRNLREQMGLSPAEITAVEYATARRLFPKYDSD